MKHAETMEKFKVYSQNMGHESTEITDRLYGRLSHDNVKSVILGEKQEKKSSPGGMSEQELEDFRQFQQFKKWLESQKNS